jgi:hypothetical protein
MTLPITTSALPVAVFGLLAGMASAPAFAQSPAQGLLDNSWVFNAGVFVLGTDITANLNGTSTNNPEIDFDKTFGKADDGTRGRLDALWRINPKHHLRFLYFDNSTTRSKVLDKDVAWGDYVFLKGSSTEAETRFKTYEVAYEYAFARSPSYEVAGSIGIHAMDISLKLAGTANVLNPDGTVKTTAATTKTSDFLAPLPVIGIRGGWVVAPQWYIDAQAQIFSINSGDYGGRWTDVRAGATWMFHPNFGVGLGYNWFGSRIDVDKDNFNGRVKVGYSGLQAYLTGTF